MHDEKSKFDRIVKQVEQKVEEKIVQKRRRKKDLPPEVKKDENALAKRIMKAYNEVIRLAMLVKQKQEANGFVKLSNLPTPKKITLGTKELGIYKKIIDKYGYDAFYSALEIVALSSKTPQDIKPELVAAEAKNKYLTEKAFKSLKGMFQRSGLAVVPLYVVRTKYEKREISGSYVCKISNDGVIKMSGGFILDVPSGVEIVETYENNLSSVVAICNAGFEPLKFVPSPFSVSLGAGLWGIPLEDKKDYIKIGVVLRKIIDCSNYSYENNTIKRDNPLGLEVKYFDYPQTVNLPKEYVWYAAEVKKHINPNTVLLINGKDFPYKDIAAYLRRRTEKEVIITNGFNPNKEYMETIIMVVVDGFDLEKIIFTVDDFMSVGVDGLILLTNIEEADIFYKLICSFKKFLRGINLVFTNLYRDKYAIT